MSRTIRRRRFQARTDYKSRLSLLKSEKPRIVVRKTNSYILAQIVETEIAQDKVILGVSSRDLLKNGWPKAKKGSLKSLQASYLTGFLLGNQAKEKVKEAIVDLGLNRHIPKSRLCAVIKGASDAGLKIAHKPEALPSDEDLGKNEELKKLMEDVKSKI